MFFVAVATAGGIKENWHAAEAICRHKNELLPTFPGDVPKGSPIYWTNIVMVNLDQWTWINGTVWGNKG